MCKCEAEFANRYVPHQIRQAAPCGFERIAVTLGFVDGICHSCRGQPEPACPKVERPGRMSKLRRYYWREIRLLVIPRFAAWAQENGYSDWIVALRENRDVYRQLVNEATEQIRQLHSVSPKYAYGEEPQSSVLARHGVEIVSLRPRRIRQDESTVFKTDSGLVGSAIEVAQEHFSLLGYTSIFTESRPFHAIFSNFMWPVVQDANDPKALPVVRRLGRGANPPTVPGRKCSIHPADFGTAQYGHRRASAIECHIDSLGRV